MVFFSSSVVYSYQDWNVNFKSSTATITENNKSTKTINLRHLPRNLLWYYSEVPINPKNGDREKESASAFKTFPYSVCEKITYAYQSDLKAYKFHFTAEKRFFFDKIISCTIDFEKSICKMSIGGDPVTVHGILNEKDYESKLYWEPEEYNLYTSQIDRFTYKDECRELNPNSEEWKKISDYFYLTVPKEKNGEPINPIVKIYRYYNNALKKAYTSNLNKAREKHTDPLFAINLEMEKLLWHGTGGTPPTAIANGGWNVTYSSDKNLWGPGTYFASDAAYSAGYAHQVKETGHKQMFLAKVITGLGFNCLENRNIRDCPNVDGYNSIVGWRHGSWIYVLYDNSIACPWYLVEWAEK